MVSSIVLISIMQRSSAETRDLLIMDSAVFRVSMAEVTSPGESFGFSIGISPTVSGPYLWPHPSTHAESLGWKRCDFCSVFPHRSGLQIRLGNWNNYPLARPNWPKSAVGHFPDMRPCAFGELVTEVAVAGVFASSSVAIEAVVPVVVAVVVPSARFPPPFASTAAAPSSSVG